VGLSGTRRRLRRDPHPRPLSRERARGELWQGGSCGGSGGDGGFEGFGVGQALFPGLAPLTVEVFGDFEVEGLAGSVWGVVDQGAEHGLGSGEEAELALVVGTEVFRAVVEDAGVVDLAGFGDGFAAAEVEVDEGHGARCGALSRHFGATIHRVPVRVNAPIEATWHRGLGRDSALECTGDP
jgi:hypothetical protein